MAESEYGTVIGTAEIYNSPAGTLQPMTANNRGDFRIALALPKKTELTRMGNTWMCAMATGSAFTYVAAWPTTRAELVLYNGEPSGGKSYLIDKAWMANISSMAAAQPLTLLGQLVGQVATVPTDDANQLIVSRNGKGLYSGRAKRAVANTAAGQIANKWEVLASLVPGPTTNLGAAVVAELNGGFIVPPGGVFALAGLAGTAAGTAIIGVIWNEVQLALG